MLPGNIDGRPEFDDARAKAGRRQPWAEDPNGVIGVILSPHRARARTLLLLLTAGLVFIACGDDEGPTGPARPSFEWSGAIEAGDRLDVRGVNGAIEASAVSGRTATVTAQVRENGGDASSVDIQVVTHSGGVTICAIYPDVAGEMPNRCEPGGGSQSADSPVTVDFVVQVPSDVEYTSVTVNGDITALGLERAANLVTVDGNVEATTTSILTIATVNGSIDATLEAAALPGPWSLTTVNGGVAARLPETVGASFTGTVVNGSVVSDFAITETAPGVWSGTIGSGGPSIAMAVVNGNLALVRRF
ncbi:MAG: hypothetical protein P8049_11480 [Gemmatimonadota bacterium]